MRLTALELDSKGRVDAELVGTSPDRVRELLLLLTVLLPELDAESAEEDTPEELEGPAEEEEYLVLLDTSALLLPPGTRERELTPVELDANVLRDDGPGSELVGSAELELDDRVPTVDREAGADPVSGRVLDDRLSGHVVERALLPAEDVIAVSRLELGPLLGNPEDSGEALVRVELVPPGKEAGLLLELVGVAAMEDGSSEDHDEDVPVERGGCPEDELEDGGTEDAGALPCGRVSE